MSSKKRLQAQRKRTQRQQKRSARKTRRRPPRIQASAARKSQVAEPATTSEASLQRWSRLLTKAERDPDSVLGDPRCLKPPFVKRFFDLGSAPHTSGDDWLCLVLPPDLPLFADGFETGDTSAWSSSVP